MTWTGQKFSVSFEDDLGAEHLNQKLAVTIAGELSKDGKKLKRVAVKRRNYGVNSLGESWEELREYAVTDIPRQFDTPTFRVGGAEVKNHVSGIVDYHKTNGNTVNDYSYTSTDWGGKFAPAIDVTFYQ